MMERNQINKNNQNQEQNNFNNYFNEVLNQASLYLNGLQNSGGDYCLCRNATFDGGRSRRSINWVNNNDLIMDRESDLVSICAMTIGGLEKLRRMAEEEEGMKDVIIMKVTADLPRIMVHRIGFEFAKTVFEWCDENQISRVLQSVVLRNQFRFLRICNDYYGRQAVMTLMKNLKVVEQVLTITMFLIDHICSFTNCDHDTKQLLQFFIQVCNHDLSIKLLFDAMAKNCIAIATNRYGFDVLQHYICPTNINKGFAIVLIESAVINSPILAEDKYGNYLIQYVISLRIEGIVGFIVERLEGRFCDMAKSRGGSNVVEKCLEVGEQYDIIKIVKEFTNSTQLLSIAQDPFGNCVLQRAFEQAYHRGTVEVYHNLVKSINVHASTLQTHMYGSVLMYKIHNLNKYSHPNE